MDNPSFMIVALYERQREIGELMNGSKIPGEAAGPHSQNEKPSAGEGAELVEGREVNNGGDESQQNNQPN